MATPPLLTQRNTTGSPPGNMQHNLCKVCVCSVTMASMLSSGGYRSFREYATANNPRDPLILNVQDLLHPDHAFSGASSRIFDSDTDSDTDFNDARSHLGEHQAIEARSGRNQVIYFQQEGDYLHQAFELAAEYKVSSAIGFMP